MLPDDDGHTTDFSPSLIKLSRSLAAASTTSPATAVSKSPPHKLCILTLLRILDNILLDINTPHDQKNARIRKIKTTGPFHDRAGQYEGSIDFLIECCGFERTTNIQLKLVNDNPSRLMSSRNELVRFSVERLGLLESKLPDCPVLDMVIASTQDQRRESETVETKLDPTNDDADQTYNNCDSGIIDEGDCATSLEVTSGQGVCGSVAMKSTVEHDDSSVASNGINDGAGQQIQPSNDEIMPTLQQQQQQQQQMQQQQMQQQQMQQKRHQADHVPQQQHQLPLQEPDEQPTPEDVPSQPILSSSDSMSSLLEEIENELNDDNAFFLDGYTSSGHDHGGIVGEEEVATMIDEQLPMQDTVFTTTGSFMEEFLQTTTTLTYEGKDETLSATLEGIKVSSLDMSNRVRLEQTKHVEEEDVVIGNTTIASAQGDIHYTEINDTKIVDAIRIDDPVALDLPEMVEELLTMQSQNDETTLPQSVACGGSVDLCTKSEATTIEDGTADVLHFHEHNNSASDLLVDLESNNLLNGKSLTVSTSLQLQQELSRETNDGNHPLIDKRLNIDKIYDEQPMSDCNGLPYGGDDLTMQIEKGFIDNDNAAIFQPTPTSQLKDNDYSSLFKQIPHPDGEFFSASDNEDIIQYRLGFELCHSALFSIWLGDTMSGTDARSHRKRSEWSTWANPCAGLTNLNVHKRSEVEAESITDVQSSLACRRPIILVPLDVAFASWACILHLKPDDDIANDGPSISSDGLSAGKIYSWIVSNHRQLSVIDDNIPPSQDSILSKRDHSDFIGICNFVCKSLRDIGLIDLYSANILEGVSDDSTLYIGVEGVDYTIPKLDDSVMLRKCHGVLSRLLYPRILNELGLLHKNDRAHLSTNPDLLCWYSCHYLVKHMIESDQVLIAKRLLLDTRFIQLRMQYMDCLAGTYAHCRDCARLSFGLSHAKKYELTEEDSPRVSFGAFADGIEDLDSKFTDIQKNDVAGWNEDHLKILCSISSVLRGKVGEISSHRSEGNELKKDVGRAMQMIGEFIGDIGPYHVQEMEHYEEAFRLLTEAHGDDQNHKSVSDILYVIGCHHQRFNHFKFAQKCYEQSLRIYKVTTGSEHQCVAQVLHNIGIIYHSLGNNAIALKCFNKSLSIRLLQLNERDISLADSYCWIGKIHREEKRFSKAHENFVAAHQIKVAILGAGHIESAEVLQNIGIVCDDLGLCSQSLSCFRKVLFIRLATVCGANDVNGNSDVCETLDCIANVYRAKGERQKALLFFEQCLRRRVRIVQAALSDKGQVALLLRTYEDVIALTRREAKENYDDQRKLGTLYLDIGKLYDQQLNKRSRALTFMQKALQIFKQGKDYKLIGNTLSLIGGVHVKRSAHQKAIKCFNDSLVMQKMTSETKETTEIADTLHNIGNCEAKMGNFENSLPAFQEAMRMKKKIYPAEHLSISKTEHCAGLVMSQLGNLGEAQKLFLSSLNARRAMLGHDHLDVSFSLHSLGKIYFFQDKADDAIACLEEALNIKKSKLPDKHMSLAETLHLLGSLYNKKGTYAPAIPLLNSALVAYRGRRDCEIMKSDVLDLLGSAYAKIGDTDNAILSYEHSLKIKQSVVGVETIPCANVLMEIGKLKYLNNDDDGALAAFKEVKTIHKKTYNKNHLKNADLLIQVGLIQERLDNDDLALRCFVEALKIRRNLLEQSHRDIAAAIVCVGRLYQSKCDHVNAITSFQDAIKIYQGNDGDNESHECGSASRLLGLSQLAIGESDSAIASLEFCLDGRARTFGTESKEWAEAAYSLGVAKSESGLHDDAISLLEQFVLLQKNCDYSDLQSLASALLSLGKIFVNKRKVDNAMACFDEALGFMKQSNDDQGASEVLYQIGSIRESKKQYLESLVCYEESLKLRISAVGEDEATADIVSRIGELHRMRGHFDLALEKFTLALDMYKCAVGESHLSVANTYHSLGYVCDAMDDAPKSMQNHKEGLSVRKLILGGNHVLVASSLDDIAGMYQKQNEHQKALRCLKEALRIRRLQLRDDDIEISKTLFGMGIVFAAINDNENAAECYKTSLEISSRADSHPKLEAQTLHQIGCLEAAKCNYREALHNWRTCLSKYRESGLRDDHYMVACTLGNIEMAENVLRT